MEVAINVEPDILIVDEALSVGDVFFQNKCFKKFDELRKRGVTILFVSHDIGSVRQMCSRVLWLEKGSTRAFGEAGSICDMYMDAQRKSSEYVSGHITDEIRKKRIIQQFRLWLIDLKMIRWRYVQCISQIKMVSMLILYMWTKRILHML